MRAEKRPRSPLPHHWARSEGGVGRTSSHDEAGWSEASCEVKSFFTLYAGADSPTMPVGAGCARTVAVLAALVATGLHTQLSSLPPDRGGGGGGGAHCNITHTLRGWLRWLPWPRTREPAGRPRRRRSLLRTRRRWRNRRAWGWTATLSRPAPTEERPQAFK